MTTQTQSTQATRSGVQNSEHAQSNDSFVVDVRTPAEYNEVHVEGTLNFPLGDLSRSATKIAELAAGRPVTLLCRTGKRAEEGRKLLTKAGVQDAYCMEGGIEAWIGQGNPVKRSGTKAVSIERQVRIAAGVLVFLGSIAAWFINPAFVVLPGFVGAGLVFAGVTDTCGMAMVLAKMPWNKGQASGASCSA